MNLNQEQLKRYRRNISIPAIGEQGQEKLVASRVLVVGAGGLGSSCLYYLAAAGIGTIGIADCDRVEVDNLQRQILHSIKDLGRLKVESAKEKINDLNPLIKVLTYKEKISNSNALGIASQYDLIIECSDNFTTKLLLNNAAVSSRKPLVIAAVLRFEAQIMTVLPDKSACYRCLFPSFPKEGAFLSPKQAGILGTAAGLAGIIQANQAIKYILGKGEFLLNKLLVIDLFSMDFRKLTVAKRPGCPTCGSK